MFVGSSGASLMTTWCLDAQSRKPSNATMVAMTKIWRSLCAIVPTLTCWFISGMELNKVFLLYVTPSALWSLRNFKKTNILSALNIIMFVFFFYNKEDLIFFMHSYCVLWTCLIIMYFIASCIENHSLRFFCISVVNNDPKVVWKRFGLFS